MFARFNAFALQRFNASSPPFWHCRGRSRGGKPGMGRGSSTGRGVASKTFGRGRGLQGKRESGRAGERESAKRPERESDLSGRAGEWGKPVVAGAIPAPRNTPGAAAQSAPQTRLRSATPPPAASDARATPPPTHALGAGPNVRDTGGNSVKIWLKKVFCLQDEDYATLFAR